MTRTVRSIGSPSPLGKVKHRGGGGISGGISGGITGGVSGMPARGFDDLNITDTLAGRPVALGAPRTPPPVLMRTLVPDFKPTKPGEPKRRHTFNKNSVVQFQGYLMKLKSMHHGPQTRKPWHKRFCQLRDGFFLWFSYEGTSKPNGWLRVRDVKRVRVCDTSLPLPGITTTHSLCLAFLPGVCMFLGQAADNAHAHTHTHPPCPPSAASTAESVTRTFQVDTAERSIYLRARTIQEVKVVAAARLALLLSMVFTVLLLSLPDASLDGVASGQQVLDAHANSQGVVCIPHDR